MSTKKNMFASLPPSYLPELRREAWGRLFGLSIRESRKGAGLTIEQAAPLAGIEVSEWDGHRAWLCPAGPEPVACNGRHHGNQLRPDRHAGYALQGGLGAVIGAPAGAPYS